MRGDRLARAFTLIEAMVVVVIVGILAVLAVVAYRRWVYTSYMAEAQDMIGHIRAAEESFHAENGVYLDVSGGLEGHFYPVQTPGAFKTAWGASCTVCGTHQWTQLNVQPQAPTAFVYAVHADNSGVAPAAGSIVLVSPNQPDFSSMAGGPWYIAEAKGDVNGDGNFARVYGFSGTSQLLIDNEGN
jgi:prepilin-type N-terminal cleavage/methylation domain-containing protein